MIPVFTTVCRKEIDQFHQASWQFAIPFGCLGGDGYQQVGVFRVDGNGWFCYEKRFADMSGEERAAAITVEVLPKHLDEQVATYMVQGFGGVMTKLTQKQADYIGVGVDGPFKADSYKY